MPRRLRTSILVLSLLCAGCGNARFTELEGTSSWADSSIEIHYRTWPERSRLWRVALDGSRAREVLDFAIGDYEISASGEAIAFQEKETGRCGMRDLRSLQTHWTTYPCKTFELSPDGSLLAWVTDNVGPESVHIMRRSDGESFEVLQTNGDVGGPRWSRDGTRLYARDHYRGERLLSYDVASRTSAIGSSSSIPELEELHFNQWDSSGVRWDRAISPSGRYLAMCERGSLVLVHRESGRRETLLRNTGSFNLDFGIRGFTNPTWVGDERYIVGSVASDVVVVDVTSGRAGRVVRGSHPLSYDAAFRPDPNTRANLMSDVEMRTNP